MTCLIDDDEFSLISGTTRPRSKGQPIHHKKTILGATIVVGTALIFLVWFRIWQSDGTAGADPAEDQGILDSGEVFLANRRSPQELDDPSRDGWKTEDLAGRISTQFKKLVELIAEDGPLNESAVEFLVADKFASGPIVPDSLFEAFADESFQVRRANLPEDPSADLTAIYRKGRKGFVDIVCEWISACEKPDIHFKVVDIEVSDSTISTRQFVEMSGRTPGGMLEQNATWSMEWSRPSGAGFPRILSIHVKDFEVVESTHGEDPMFSDCTDSVIGANRVYRDQLLFGLNHWLNGMQDTQILGTPGAAVGDANGDGLDDLYLCQETGLPNLLFLQNADGTATEAADAWGVNWLHSSRGALLIDWDNDGDQDLAVAMRGGVALAENDAGTRFEFLNFLPTAENVNSLAAADVDLDGDLDLYVCAYEPDVVDGDGRSGGVAALSGDIVFHDANDGGPNSLFRNEGAGRFADATAGSGFDENNRRWSFAASWEDYDNDGDQDLYVANDYGRDNLYRNEGGTFVDVSDFARIEDAGAGMSVTWADYDRDGWMDVYISNMFSSAGKRVTAQQRFKQDAGKSIRARYRRLARGNTLLKNLGDGSFRDVSGDAGVEMGRWAWSSVFLDFNNDGWEDLLVANGYLTGEDPADL
jgi:hypothetical protein